LDDSEASEGALAFALGLAAASDGRIVCCHVLETDLLLDRAATYGYDPIPILDEMRTAANKLVAEKRQPHKRAAPRSRASSRKVAPPMPSPRRPPRTTPT
jgi:nucleotide-binding universal stress UspA family protein